MIMNTMNANLSMVCSKKIERWTYLCFILLFDFDSQTWISLINPKIGNLSVNGLFAILPNLFLRTKN